MKPTLFLCLVGKAWVFCSLWFETFSLFVGWSPEGGSEGRLLHCWEVCSDFKPAFSLAGFHSCSSGRAETYKLQKHFYQFCEVILKKNFNT